MGKVSPDSDPALDLPSLLAGFLARMIASVSASVSASGLSGLLAGFLARLIAIEPNLAKNSSQTPPTAQAPGAEAAGAAGTPSKNPEAPPLQEEPPDHPS